MFVSSAFSTTLPSGYTELEYIESTGTQYIDTDFVYDNNTRVVWDIQLTAQIPSSESNNSGVGWVNNDYEKLGFTINKDDSMLRVYKAFAAEANPAGDTRLATIQVHNNRHVIEINSPINKAYVDGVEYTFDPAVGDINNDYNLTLPLFAWLGGTGYRQYFIGRMYSVKIYDNGTLARNMIPAKRNSDNAVGMYDTINDVFYTNSGTGSFTAGPEITLPEYIPLEYIESSGTQYICLNFGFDKTDEIETEFSIQDTDVCNKYMVGTTSWNTNNNRFGMGEHCWDSTYNFAYGSADNRNTSLSPHRSLDGQIHRWFYKDLVVSIPELSTSLDVSGITFGGTTTNLRLFYGGINGSVTTGKMKYYKHIKNGTVVFNGIPAKRKSDNVVGLYDLVGDTFYTNSGTGDFIAGPEVVDSTCTSATVMGENVCLIDTEPNGDYINVRYNNEQYYLMLDSENDYPIHVGSSNKLKIITNTATYNVHDASVVE